MKFLCKEVAKMGMKLKKDGMSIIKKNVGKFQSIVDGLQKGIGLCEKEIVANEKNIQTLADKNETIGKTCDQASAFKGNLEAMLVMPEEEKKEEKEE